MAVENFDSLSDLTEFLGDRTPDLCFFCGKPLKGLTAYWAGLDTNGTVVAFHPDCGVAFGARLIRDSLNAHYLTRDEISMASVKRGALAGVPSYLRPPRTK